MYHMSHSSNSVRSATYSLLLKHLKQRPDCWKVVLPGINSINNSEIVIVSIIVNSLGYIGALESGHEQVVNSALNNLPELAVLCQVSRIQIIFVIFLLMSLFQENLSHLLATVFKLNISGNLNTIPHIVTAINTINTTAGNN